MQQAWQKVDPTFYVRLYRQKSLGVLAKIPDAAVASLVEVLDAARCEARQVFICGNGGSASTATHFAAGLSKEGSLGQERRFRATSLTDNVASLTSIANDTDYSQIFVEQLKNHAQNGDVLIVFSVSGESANVVRAIEWANKNGLCTVAISGRTGGTLGRHAQHKVLVDSSHMGHVEEAHFLIQHLVTYYFMETA
jgi:D-sedoheptulose 7-phosphate isomerase